MLPASAPTAIELGANNSETSDFNYSPVDLDGRIVARLTSFRPSLPSKFKGPRYTPSNALGTGDVVAVTVYETGGQSLFPPPAVVQGAASAAAPLGAVATGASNIPPQVIESDGTIFVPFVGRVKLSGLTPGEAGSLIAQRLEGKAVSPQVLVSLVNNLGTAATVGGDVASPRSVPLGSRGERLLDVIAAAGGSKFPAYDTYVQIVRDGVTGHVLLQTIINNPSENIFIRPKDQIYLVHSPRTFSVLGASQRVNAYPFGKEKVSLAEAIAKGGGPVDAIGDPGGIYLFRFEPINIARDILGPAIEVYGSTPPDFIPMLYHIDMRDAQGYFIAQAVEMRDKDVVLVTNAGTTQLRKFLAIVKGVSGIAYDFARVDELGRR